MARSHTTFAGSCTAVFFRHGASAADNSRSNPVARTASTNSTPPACETTREPAVSTFKDG
jgi:hypothetical protein